MKKFYRDMSNSMFLGVCSGISEYFNIDLVIVRLIFIISNIFFVIPVIIYIVMAIISPEGYSHNTYYRKYRTSFYRKSDGKILFGVCNGIGERLETDPTIIRFIFLILAALGLPIFIYFILAVILPRID